MSAQYPRIAKAATGAAFRNRTARTMLARPAPMPTRTRGSRMLVRSIANGAMRIASGQKKFLRYSLKWMSACERAYVQDHGAPVSTRERSPKSRNNPAAARWPTTTAAYGAARIQGRAPRSRCPPIVHSHSRIRRGAMAAVILERSASSRSRRAATQRPAPKRAPPPEWMRSVASRNPCISSRSRARM